MDANNRNDSARAISPYAFEPQKKEDDQDTNSASETSSNSESSDSDDSDYTREGNTDWCLCGKCDHSLLKNLKEHLCCQEKRHTKAKAVASENEDSTCITNNEDFTILCLHPVVLQNVLVGLNNVRGDVWDINNKSKRFAAYKQFTWWVHHRLGKGRRRVVPACASHLIRSTFPTADNEDYEGYHSGDDEDYD